MIISDLHCGSIFGLCPPGWNSPKHIKLQKEAWRAYKKMVDKWYMPDILIVNGDCIDGREDRQGGAELLTNDRNVQCEMAIKCIKEWDAGKIFMSYGTTYHTGAAAEDFEYLIAKAVGAKIGGRLFLKVEDMIIDARHKVGRSVIPQGRAAPLMRDMMWNTLRAADEEEPKANILIRSHVHYHLWVEEGPQKVMFTTPSLQLSRGRYGSRECVGATHWGAIRLTLNKGQIVGKDVNIWNLVANKIPLIKIV